jgi:hypothetical protein
MVDTSQKWILDYVEVPHANVAFALPGWRVLSSASSSNHNRGLDLPKPVSQLDFPFPYRINLQEASVPSTSSNELPLCHRSGNPARMQGL